MQGLPTISGVRRGIFARARIVHLTCRYICTRRRFTVRAIARGACDGCKPRDSQKNKYRCCFCTLLQAPFANKGPKWYLNLVKKCKHGNTRDNVFSKLEQNIKTLITLGETSAEIIEQILGLECMEICPKPILSLKAAAPITVYDAPRLLANEAPRNARDLHAAVRYCFCHIFNMHHRHCMHGQIQNSLADLGTASLDEKVVHS